MTEPTGLGERGLAIYRNYVSETTDAARAALALEAARTADRLDELDNIIQGKGVLNLMQFRLNLDELDDEANERHVHVEVKFAAPMAEARQQAIAFSSMLKTLGMEGSAEAKPQPAAPATAEDEMKRRREEREKRRKAAAAQ